MSKNPPPPPQPTPTPTPSDNNVSNSPLTPSQRRLQKELLSMIRDPPVGIQVDLDCINGFGGDNDNSSQSSTSSGSGSSSSNNHHYERGCTYWRLRINGPTSSLYAGEVFQLSFKFTANYPFDSPEVVFVGDNIPVHPHIYSNGHICLSILTEDWSPALSVSSVCLSIISMLGSCKDKKRPPDDAFYIRTCNKNPKKTKWWYHDDKV